MNVGSHQIAQGSVNHLMPLDLGFSVERFSHDEGGEMSTAALHGPGMPCMRSAIVNNLQLHRRQSLLQRGPNSFDTIAHKGNTCLKGLMVTCAYTPARE
jgi:hypothetical protein